MKNLKLLIILIFGLNLLGEVGSGHCDEGRELKSIEAHFAKATLFNALPDSPTTGTHADCEHICHFGHCGHLLHHSTLNVDVVSLAEPLWISIPTTAPWRSVAPLFKPPIPARFS